jgi:hypothetical protein
MRGGVNLLKRLLNRPILSRVRRNHGLEHATIHVLTERYPNTTFIGRSDGRGFFIYGQVPTEAVRNAVKEALERLRSGERDLAIHPTCGTNLVTAGILAGTASFLSLLGTKEEDWRERLKRLPTAIAATTLALIIAQPVGRAAQEYLTTEPNPGSLEIVAVHPLRSGRGNVHRILTAN